MLESLILYLKGMRILMFQLSGFYYSIWALGFSMAVTAGSSLGKPMIAST